MRAGWIAGIVLVSACSKPHVTLPTMSPNLTPEQRVQMFNELHATWEKTTNCGGGEGCKTLYLANGVRVHHPEDLLPVVEPDSITSRAIRDVHKARRKALGYSGVALASLAGLITIVSFWFERGFGQTYPGLDEMPFRFSSSEKVGLLVTGAGMLVGMFGSWHYNRQAGESWGKANENYNAGLAQRLAVCISGFAVVPCESSPTAAPVSSPPTGLLPGPLPPPAQPSAAKPAGP